MENPLKLFCVLKCFKSKRRDEKMGSYIVFEGVMGTGKTTLTKMLSSKLGYKTMFEIVEENPFLEKFYQDPEHWSFQTECFFLCNRYMQLKQVRDMLEDGKNVIGDYHIMKNLIFAGITLKGEELEKYKDLYHTMLEGFKLPDIIVYSEASLEEVKRRIGLRGRKMEQDIEDSYLLDLINAYKEQMDVENLMEKYPGTKLIKIDSDSIDFYETPEKLNCLQQSILKAKQGGVGYQLLD